MNSLRENRSHKPNSNKGLRTKLNTQENSARGGSYGNPKCSQMAGTFTIFVAALAVGLIGALALIQAYFIGQCFRAGQPQENGYINNDCI